MPRLFAVLRSAGPDWASGGPLEEQPEWRQHAEFMTALEEEGFVLLGGPLAGTGDVLLVVPAGDAQEVERKLAGDPWSRSGILPVTAVHPWTIRLDSIGAADG